MPSVFVTLGNDGFGFDYVWMLAVTLVMLALVAQRRGAGRVAGAAIVCSYVAYVAITAATSG